MTPAKHFFIKALYYQTCAKCRRVKSSHPLGEEEVKKKKKKRTQPYGY